MSQAGEAFRSGRLPEAAQLCLQVLEADRRQPRAWHLLGIIAHLSGDTRRAVELIRKAIGLDARFAAAHNDLGNLLVAQGKPADAIAAYRRAIALSPGFAEAWNNLGNACQLTDALEEALASYRQAIALSPAYPEAHRNLGSALRRAGRVAESLAAFETAVSLNPQFSEALALVVQEMRELCAWEGLDALSRRLVEIVENGTGTVNPFIFLSLDTTPAQQFRCAAQWAAAHLPAAPPRPPSAPAAPGRRITLGYLSADFQEHATAHLISELISLHDRDRFQVNGYSYGRDDGSPARRRLSQSFDRFVDLEPASFAEAATRIRADAVDILVDLKGYTAGARPQILALRPAPIQVNYLGYPGTMGASAFDYILVDPYVVPPRQQPFFSEKLVYMPHCYQVTDCTRPIAPRVPTRAECGLPETGFVFCCFNSSYKITPPVFDVWMRLLAAVPASALWLLEDHPEASANLRREAQSRGVAAARLVFAPGLPSPSHLARFALADLFLDTLPYNAHTLASDALWGGCPLVTCSGEAFPSRVAGSLLRAVGLPDLVTNSLADYEALALRLATGPDYCRAIRARLRANLRANRLASPLFDTRRFARDLEVAYLAMYHAQ